MEQICTLSMLSSENLKGRGFFKVAQMRMLLVDEASQIRVDEYPVRFPSILRLHRNASGQHVFHYFRENLETVAFFGDHMQLAPYQSADIKQIKSVFENKHLGEGNENFHFLDTQYRMPSVVGDFLSKMMYRGKLQSSSSVHPSENAVLFVDCKEGREVQLSEGGSKNPFEAEKIVELVRLWYQHKEFKVITPYDAQRDLIEKSLKHAELPWEDRVFNVDSFQGQECDYILISVVRTEKVGFLKEAKRSNVMLSRLKKGMVIVTNRGFCEGAGKHTLVAQLGIEGKWMSSKDIGSGDVRFP
ncbi:hypothetical protein BT69DRAFT_936292 [Atractiella rhizophila]|nr:hypothetical protein BT69DRAFT_936292 [Atractiella rhizophila]